MREPSRDVSEYANLGLRGANRNSMSLCGSGERQFEGIEDESAFSADLRRTDMIKPAAPLGAAMSRMEQFDAGQVSYGPHRRGQFARAHRRQTLLK